MFTGNQFPKYLHKTPIIMEAKHPFAIMEPNSGEQILPKDYMAVLSARHRMIIDGLQHVFRKCGTYAGIIEAIEQYSKEHDDAIDDTLHHLIEDEEGQFSIGLQIAIKATPTDFAIYLATAMQVRYEPEKFGEIYLVDEEGEIDDLSILAVTATSAMSILAQNCDLENPKIIEAIEGYLAIHKLIDAERWAGVKCELLGGIPPVIVMRRWGLLNSTVLTSSGRDENTIFAELAERLC